MTKVAKNMLCLLPPSVSKTEHGLEIRGITLRQLEHQKGDIFSHIKLQTQLLMGVAGGIFSLLFYKYVNTYLVNLSFLVFTKI